MQQNFGNVDTILLVNMHKILVYDIFNEHILSTTTCNVYFEVVMVTSRVASSSGLSQKLLPVVRSKHYHPERACYLSETHFRYLNISNAKNTRTFSK